MFAGKPDTIPLDREKLPAEIRKWYGTAPVPDPAAYFAILEDALTASGWVRVILGVDGSQRCSGRLMRMTAEFQRRHGAATHMLETKTQAAIRGGEGFVRRMVASGILNERSSLVHWSRDDDIAAARAAGVTVVHCPQSNVMLGAGNCPVLRLREAGMQVALGTDGGNCGPANYLENLRFTTGFMRLTEPDFEKWPDSDVGTPTRPAQGRRDGRARPAKSRPTRADLVVLHPLARGGSLSSSASQRQLGGKRVWVDGRRVRERPRCRRRRGRADRRRDRRPPPGVVATEPGSRPSARGMMLERLAADTGLKRRVSLR